MRAPRTSDELVALEASALKGLMKAASDGRDLGDREDQARAFLCGWLRACTDFSDLEGLRAGFAAMAVFLREEKEREAARARGTVQ